MATIWCKEPFRPLGVGTRINVYISPGPNPSWDKCKGSKTLSVVLIASPTAALVAIHANDNGDMLLPRHNMLVKMQDGGRREMKGMYPVNM